MPVNGAQPLLRLRGVRKTFPGTVAVAGAVVSTPYLYAQEVLADGRGLLVPFADSAAMAEATLRFLHDPVFQVQTRRRAFEYAQPMFWPEVGRKYLEFFNQLAPSRKIQRKRRPAHSAMCGAADMSIATVPGGP